MSNVGQLIRRIEMNCFVYLLYLRTPDISQWTWLATPDERHVEFHDYTGRCLEYLGVDIRSSNADNRS